ncbi:MAG: hypothetical protein CFH22_01064 [Alphaproteobacteria bacterium MarineAlpha5_Bin12]|nr:hypothetical protein [Pelagibacteraceae bacterium]PPR40935.1 MAG: hypothetical protein CFH22_01064 [Alphaproteobacteria bacterium MarineAlpha5_Bin12]|tara:strand:- start:2469 stop:3953 length:1485 start_codon:yes stop_codon:yes gene_type:complete
MKKINKQTIQTLINYYKSSDLAKLEKEVKKLLKTFPDEEFLYNILGISFVERKKFGEAISTFKKTLSINPNNAEIFCNIGNTYFAQRKFSQSIKNYQKSLSIKPDYAEAHYNLGNAYKEKLYFDDAILSYKNAIKYQNDHAEAYSNLGNIKKYQNNFKDAKKYYQKALKIKPDYSAAYINLGYLNLSLNNFKEGWEAHEKRGEALELIKDMGLNNYKLWDGKKFSGSLMIIGEQGLGDYILFGSMLNDLLKFHKNITFMINERLLSLFQRSFPKINFIKFDKNINKYEFDKYILLGSIGRFLRKTTKDFSKKQIQFIFSDKNKVKKINNEIDINKKLKIGISWQTESINNPKERSIKLKQLLPILKNSNYEFINLQYGDTKKERLELDRKFKIKILNLNSINYTKDIEEVTAIASQCDLVITIANFTAQLSSSLGVPTWVILPYSCHWRWSVNTEESLWYPTAKIFRQKKWGDWDTLIKDVSIRLNEFKKIYKL